MTDIVTTALPHAKVLMYSDTNHHNPLITKPASSKPFLETLRDGNVTGIKIEVGREHQPLIDKYNDGILTLFFLRNRFKSRKYEHHVT